MLWPVTVVGALVGGLGGALPGALLGAVVGHALDRHWRLRRWSDLPARLADLRTGDSGFERVLFLCLGRLAKASGRVSQQHLQLARDLMQQYRLDEAARLAAMRDFNEGKTAGELGPLVRALLSTTSRLRPAGARSLRSRRDSKVTFFQTSSSPTFLQR